jgi:iron complex outermembrane receptor protein
MSHRREKRARRISRAANAALMTAVSLDALCMAAPRMAQAQTAPAATAPQENLEEVIITGYRASLESALNNKRNSTLPIESVAPEDIGKMPDQNVAESLQRLPGIQIDRAGGQGTAVLIDGLRQNLTTLNGDLFLTGREFYTSGEASGGGAGSNSQYSSLEGIPSENISGIDVYKNPQASMTEGGIGGTIDLKTRDPLAQPLGLSGGGNFRESVATGAGGAKPDGTLVGSYKFNDQFAVTASFSYDEEDTFTKEFQDQNRNQWLTTNSATGPYTGTLTAANTNPISVLPATGATGGYYTEPQLAYFTNVNDQRKIYGGSFGVAAKVTDAITSRLDWFYSREDDVTIDYTDKAFFNGQGDHALTSTGAPVPHPGIDPTQPYAIDPNGVIESGTFNANGAETATLYQSFKSKANNLQWKTYYDNGGPLTGKIDVSWAQATSDLEAAQADVEHGLYETSSGAATAPGAPGCNNGNTLCATDPNGSHGYEFVYANGGTSGRPSVYYPTNVLSDPAFTTFKSNWAWAQKSNNTQWAVKADGALDESDKTGIDSRLSVGFRIANRNIEVVFGRYLINGTLANGEIAGNANGPNPSNPGAAFGPYDYYQDPGYGTPHIPFSTALSNPGLALTVNNWGAGNIIVKNPNTGGMTNPSTYLESVWSGAGVPNMTEAFFKDNLSSFDVNEYTTAEYFMEDFGGKQDPFHLNFGVRIVSTSLTIAGGQTAPSPTYYGTASWNGVDSNVIPIQTNRSFTDVLPSFNVEANLSDTQKLRLGAARVESPMDLYSLGLGNSYNFTRTSTGAFTFANGSSGNAMLDPYRATQALLSYENYFARSGLVSVAGFWKQIDSFVETQNVPTVVQGTEGNITEPVNAGKGRVVGLELGAQYALDSTMFRGVGVAANYTLSQSSSDQATYYSTHSSIPGVAHDAFTVQAYYERFGFSGRLSYSYQGSRVNDSLVGATFPIYDKLGNTRILQVYAAAYGQLDAQISYDINSHVGVVVSAQNLTDEAAHTYLQWPDQPFTYDDWGRRYFFGVKFKL